MAASLSVGKTAEDARRAKAGHAFEKASFLVRECLLSCVPQESVWHSFFVVVADARVAPCVEAFVDRPSQRQLIFSALHETLYGKAAQVPTHSSSISINSILLGLTLPDTEVFCLNYQYVDTSLIPRVFPLVHFRPSGV